MQDGAKVHKELYFRACRLCTNHHLVANTKHLSHAQVHGDQINPGT